MVVDKLDLSTAHANCQEVLQTSNFPKFPSNRKYGNWAWDLQHASKYSYLWAIWVFINKNPGKTIAFDKVVDLLKQTPILRLQESIVNVLLLTFPKYSYTTYRPKVFSSGNTKLIIFFRGLLYNYFQTKG